MGLASVLQKAAQTAFKVIDDIPLTCSYASKGTPLYNPATGVYTSTDTEYPGLSILFEDFTAKEINESGGVILKTDQKASIPNLSLTPTPKITDYIIDSNSKKWTIQDILIDPARALWIFQARFSGDLATTYWGSEMVGYWDTEMIDLWATEMGEVV